MTNPTEDEKLDAILKAYEGGEMDAAGTIEDLADLIEAQAAEIARLREALERIAADAYVLVDTPLVMYEGWRKIAVERIDIARATIKRA